MHDSDRATPVTSVIVVVPCYNERLRLDLAGFDVVARAAGVQLCFVDDGSTDDTVTLLESWAKTRSNVVVVRLEHNRGKAEAVRAGLNVALQAGPEIVAYYDADLACPPSELLRCIDLVRADDGIDVAMGARVALLGRNIERTRSRHYQGRVFASIASLMLQMPVYDTQCGLKVFRVGAALQDAVRDPFTSRWVFDVELLWRLSHADEPVTVDRIVEVPLREWRDVGSSRLTAGSKLGAVIDLGRLAWVFRSRRSHGGPHMTNSRSS